MQSSDPDLDDDESIHREYPNDVRIVEYVDDDLLERRYRFEAPMHDPKVFERPKLAELYADVYFDIGFRDEKTGKRGVPPAVARQGQDTLAAYLVTQRGFSIEWVSRSWDISEDTVRTYLSRVRRRARDEREKAEN